jgi:hypothetical protein
MGSRICCLQLNVELSIRFVQLVRRRFVFKRSGCPQTSCTTVVQLTVTHQRLTNWTNLMVDCTVHWDISNGIGCLATSNYVSRLPSIVLDFKLLPCSDCFIALCSHHLHPRGKTRYPLYRRLGGPQCRSGRVRKNLASTGIRSPDRPARNQSLYRLS